MCKLRCKALGPVQQTPIFYVLVSFTLLIRMCMLSRKWNIREEHKVETA